MKTAGAWRRDVTVTPRQRTRTVSVLQERPVTVAGVSSLAVTVTQTPTILMLPVLSVRPVKAAGLEISSGSVSRYFSPGVLSPAVSVILQQRTQTNCVPLDRLVKAAGNVSVQFLQTFNYHYPGVSLPAVSVTPRLTIQTLSVLWAKHVRVAGKDPVLWSYISTLRLVRCLEPGCQCDPTSNNPDELCPFGQTCEGCR